MEPSRTDGTPRRLTVVAVDISWSMALSGLFAAAKEAVLRLAAAHQHPPGDDRLVFIAFSAYARQIEAGELHALRWDESVIGTNLEAAILLAREICAEIPGSDHRLLVLTDGDFDTHLEQGRAFFARPPSPVTIRRTLENLRACVDAGIAVSIVAIAPRRPALAIARQMEEIKGVSIEYAGVADAWEAALESFRPGWLQWYRQERRYREMDDFRGLGPNVLGSGSYTAPTPAPWLLLMRGQAGTGKSTLARALARRLGWALIDKDDIKDVINGHTEEAGRLAYTAMFRVARRQLASGNSVICDSPLSFAGRYREARDIATATRAHLAVLETVCPDEGEWQRRIDGRKGRNLPAYYQIDWQSFQPVRAEWERSAAYSITVPHLQLDTTYPLDSLVNDAARWLGSLAAEARQAAM